MMPPTSIDGTDITGATIDGQDVQEITVDGQTVFSAGPQILISDIGNFESGTLDPSFSGETGDYLVDSSSPTLTGTFSLKKVVTGPGPITSESGLSAYPTTDQRFACYAQGENFPSIHWATQANQLGYGIGVGVGNNELLLAKYAPNRDELTPRTSVSLSTNVWYDVEVEWKSNGDITCRIFDVDQSTGARQGGAIGSISANDTTFTTGGIGFDNLSSSGTTKFDNYRILENI